MEKLITPIDRGIARPVQTDQISFDLEVKIKNRLAYREKYLKCYQRKQKLKTIAKLKEQDTNLKNDFWHKTTHTLATSVKVIGMEDLKLKNMTHRPKPKQAVNGKWLKTGLKPKRVQIKRFSTLGCISSKCI